MRRFAWLLLPFFLVGCGITAESKWASDDEVSRAVYRHEGPKSLSLYTVINVRSGSGAHSGLLVNASQRVMFDPAGTWWNPSLPERNDVHYGMSDRALGFYVDYHTRATYYTVVQTIEVAPEVAEYAMRLVQENGAVPKAMCSNSISSILMRLPGFESIRTSWFPNATMRAFAKLPGVTRVEHHDDDADDNSSVLAGQTG
ncbi:hypothetical protein [Halocynthiibacter namhaensis]|uniref:hypothetical protein n=1 Tax=Halocynthiibacter namhaensis TaxID=1290553 RepID=UPI00068D9290|nr:hypothetical protein [Halocynthiibacter namhaensis]